MHIIQAHLYDAGQHIGIVKGAIKPNNEDLLMIKVTINGETHEVEESAIDAGDKVLVDPNSPPKGLFNQDGVNQIVQDAKRGLVNPNTLIDDPDHQKNVLIQFGITLDKDGKPKVAQANEEEQFKAWYEKHAKPLEGKIEELKGENQTFQQKVISETVKSLAQAHLKESAANNPYFINGIKSSLGFDQETGNVIALENGKPAMHGNGQKMTADEWFSQEIKGGSLKDLAKDNRPSSSGFQKGSNGATDSKTINRQELGNLDPQERVNFFKEGGQIVD